MFPKTSEANSLTLAFRAKNLIKAVSDCLTKVLLEVKTFFHKPNPGDQNISAKNPCPGYQHSNLDSEAKPLIYNAKGVFCGSY